MPQPGCIEFETKFEAVPTRLDCVPERAGDGVLRSGNRLAIDVGSVRIGVASCDPAGVLATPLTTIPRGPGDLAEIARLCTERDVIEVIVGLPTSLSGKEGKSAFEARTFATELACLIAPVQVRLVDERFTTTIAHSALRSGGRDSRQRRGSVDRAAAALLLQSALDAERLTGDPAGELVGAESGGVR